MALRITIESVPLQNPQKKRTIRVLEISHASELDDVPLEGTSDYFVVSLGESAGKKKEGIIRGHQRMTWGPWKLVSKAIHALKLDLE
jgi:hypothetical protein